MIEQGVPRLELLGCLVTARLISRVREALQNILKIDYIYAWTDSSVALAWINGTTKEYRPFVQNWLNEIRKMIPPESWKYCPTQDKPADTASRGATATALMNEARWWRGPTFLTSPVNQLAELVSNKSGKADEELKHSVKMDPVQTANLTTSRFQVGMTKIIDPERYSCINRLFRVTAYVMRFVNNLKTKKSQNQLAEGRLTSNELEYSKGSWFKNTQDIIKKGDKSNQMKTSLNLIEDEEGILRCHGRLQYAPVEYESKCPILLPDNNRLTTLIIMHRHQLAMHNGVRETLTQLRMKYWIVRGRQVVKKVIAKYVACLKIEGKSYGIPSTPPLPPFRLTDELAFSRIGLDYAGPLFVKDIYTNGETKKCCIALYTCASSRALHLDLVPDLSSQVFLRSFKLFVGRRGILAKVLSDNAKAFNSAEVNGYINSLGVKWD